MWVKLKEEIDTFWNFITKKVGRMRLQLLKKFVTFMDVMEAQNSRVFNLEIFKDAPGSITGTIDEIVEQIEQNRHISSRDIGKKLNIDHKIVLKRAGYKTKLNVWSNKETEKFNESNFFGDPSKIDAFTL